MARITKKQHKANRMAWAKALSEGRVIRFTKRDLELKCDQFSFVSYPTKEQASKTLQVQLARIASGESIHTNAEIVKVKENGKSED